MSVSRHHRRHDMDPNIFVDKLFSSLGEWFPEVSSGYGEQAHHDDATAVAADAEQAHG